MFSIEFDGVATRHDDLDLVKLLDLLQVRVAVEAAVLALGRLGLLLVEDGLQLLDALSGVKVEEAQVDLVAREATSVVEAEDYFVLQQRRVDGGHAALELFVKLKLCETHKLI